MLLPKDWKHYQICWSKLQQLFPTYTYVQFYYNYFRASDGKIANAQAMKVYFDLMDAYQEAGVTTEEDVEDLKLLEGDILVNMLFYLKVWCWPTLIPMEMVGSAWLSSQNPWKPWNGKSKESKKFKDLICDLNAPSPCTFQKNYWLTCKKNACMFKKYLIRDNITFISNDFRNSIQDKRKNE